jgi:hypothetical protein
MDVDGSGCGLFYGINQHFLGGAEENYEKSRTE